MLFKSKDTQKTAKAKTGFFARQSKQKDMHEHDKPQDQEVGVEAGVGVDAVSAAHIGAGKSVGGHARILRRPRITEKTTDVAGNNVYVFDIDQRSNKIQIKEAIKEIYGVTPKKVGIVTMPKKTVYRRSGKGVTGGGKKAYVYLRDGDTLDIV